MGGCSCVWTDIDESKDLWPNPELSVKKPPPLAPAFRPGEAMVQGKAVLFCSDIPVSFLMQACF